MEATAQELADKIYALADVCSSDLFADQIDAMVTCYGFNTVDRARAILNDRNYIEVAQAVDRRLDIHFNRTEKRR